MQWDVSMDGRPELTVDLNIPPLVLDANLTTQDMAYRRLRHAIMIGALRPGTQLTIRQLADAFELSPTPIREALRRLGSENAIEIKENRRIVVPVMTRPRFEGLVGLRIALEVHAASQAIDHVTNIQVDDMHVIDDTMDRAMEAGDLDLLTVLNHDFHRLLYAAPPEQVVMPLVESVWLQLGPFQRSVLRDVTDFEYVDRHKDILLSLLRRDEEGLRRAIEADISEGIRKTGLSYLARNEAR
jgi:DNA-binding GntR family transcriptional regulator